MIMQVLNSPSTRLTFGKYVGVRWKHVPYSYRAWAIRNNVVASNYIYRMPFGIQPRYKVVRVW